MTGSYMTQEANEYTLAQELYECVADLEGINISRLNGNEVDVEGGIVMSLKMLSISKAETKLEWDTGWSSNNV